VAGWSPSGCSFEPPAFMVQSRGVTAEATVGQRTNAIRFPSGDQSGESVRFPTGVRRCLRLPSGRITQMARVPLDNPAKFETYAIRLPSGDQLGLRSLARRLKVRRRLWLPSAFMT